MRSVVTGGAGFIGSHIVDALLEIGHEVLVIDNFSTGRQENLSSASSQHKSALTICNADIASSTAAQEIIGFKPDNVFHQAAQMNVRYSVENPQFDATVNVAGMVNVLDASVRVGVKHFVFSSTGGAIYGEQESFPAAEDHRIRPECPYGVGKRAGELYLEYFSRAHGFAGISLRYANVYGPRQNAKGEAGVIAIFIERLLRGEVMVINGDGEQTRDFVNVFDVVKANLRAIEKKLGKGFYVYNVGTGVETSINSIALAIRDLGVKSGFDSKSIELRHGPALLGEQRRSVVNIGKISRELDWTVTYSVSQGLSQTFDAFRAVNK
ncbi:MAG: NAD-dependent epimerase/dehydratase family protein [Deltaproteobacteria bacterium]|nr:NAD-dependent epimerase/dehydratase family protein [Deltaproteobacteria bacterium]